MPRTQIAVEAAPRPLNIRERRAWNYRMNTHEKNKIKIQQI